MKKNQYICPSIHILGVNCEGMLLRISNTHTDTPTETDPSETPENGGTTSDSGEVPAKPFDGWNTWNWDE